MSNHFWITGTDTDVGKTLVTTYFMRYFQSKGEKVIPYKPIQTGLIVKDSKQYYGDTEFYQKFTETPLAAEDLNSYSFVEPASPHYSARLEGAQINEEVILDHLEELKSKYNRVICEGAGGLYVPIDERRNYHFLDLIKESRLPSVVVARTTLGTINHTLLTLEVLKMNDIPVAGIVFNGFEGTELEQDNIQTIKQITQLPTLVIPKLKSLAELKTLELEDDLFFERVMHV